MQAAVTACSVGDGGGQTQQAASLFLHDVKHLLRWHAVAAGVALAATPIVYQAARIVAHRYRAELVNLAKDSIQCEELFNGTETNGALIDSAEEDGILISHKSNLTDARETRGGVGGNASMLWSGSPRSPSQQSASMFALCVGRRHSWVVSPFAYQVLAAQRAPNVQFVRTCSWAAVCQYGVVVLRAATTSCFVSVASITVLYATCQTLDCVLPFGPLPAADNTKGVTPTSLLSALATAPLFTTSAPPFPAVNSTYGLYSFSVSAAGVWSRLFPRLGALQTFWQRLAGYTQPLHSEWRDGSASPLSSPHALADSVWASLSPRGYFIVSLLPRLASHISMGLWWLARRTSIAAMRRWYAASSSASPTAKVTSLTAAAATPPLSTSANTGAADAVDPCTPELSNRRRCRQPRRLIHSPVAEMAALLRGDVAYAGILFLVTSYADSSTRGGDSPCWPLVLNDANARYNLYCWAEAICSTLRLVGL